MNRGLWKLASVASLALCHSIRQAPKAIWGEVRISNFPPTPNPDRKVRRGEQTKRNVLLKVSATCMEMGGLRKMVVLIPPGRQRQAEL